MVKLIRLEWKKNRIGKYLWKAAIVAFLIGGIVFAMNYLGIANDPDTGIPDMAEGHEGISDIVELFSSIAYCIMTAVMLSNFIISAYQNGTMRLMFSYPIKRQKILVSKMLSVWIFCFLALSATKLFVYGCLFLCSGRLDASFAMDFDMGQSGFYLGVLIKSAVMVTLGFIALAVGLAVKSSKAAVGASFFLLILTQGSLGDVSLAGNGGMLLALTGISLLFAVICVAGVEKRDVT